MDVAERRKFVKGLVLHALNDALSDAGYQPVAKLPILPLQKGSISGLKVTGFPFEQFGTVSWRNEHMDQIESALRGGQIRFIIDREIYKHTGAAA
ncbi:hypothetical protein BCR33DRAFT_719589 [Rhizoclosmatium globosum]|uniref:Uncharacterized protein n=1 Tax=Rhizoclosmatium globosum TaxID=329046 RepID=A0A1Y2B7T1_9FUNG|nr:hypothetical protein BCR33DRAFT_724132 [Rhizoclosmatium globosum]ORY40214.1 hypothetical protein BCR33DRAFT_719589 [Rhizoclosmatium globosum]|eukprot:ORY30898.1 hypothetical protein BCR33DRAFT_724132 [Rhizoclosmatium globosum]